MRIVKNIPCFSSWDIHPELGHDNSDASLPHECTLARHIRTRQEHDPFMLPTHVDIIRNKVISALLPKSHRDTRVPKFLKLDKGFITVNKLRSTAWSPNRFAPFLQADEAVQFSRDSDRVQPHFSVLVKCSEESSRKALDRRFEILASFFEFADRGCKFWDIVSAFLLRLVMLLPRLGHLGFVRGSELSYINVLGTGGTMPEFEFDTDSTIRGYLE